LARTKFIFNTKTLSYEKHIEPIGKRILKLISVLSTSLAISVVTIFLVYQFADSPKEKKLKREIANLELNYRLLDQRVERINKVLKDLKERDDNIYRAIFEAEPIPDELRQSGFAGVNRYDKLEGFNYSELIKEMTKKVDKLAKATVIQSKSYDDIWNLIHNQDKMLGSIPAIMPIHQKDLKLMASGFGERIDPIYKTSHFHAGMDFVADIGKPVYATGNGTIEFAGTDDSGYGIHVKINHGFNYLTLYGHLSELKCVEGQKVKRGDLIGLVGSTGKSVGPHLHYEVHKNGTPVNPVNYYFSDLTAEEYNKLIEQSRQPSQSFD
jgi:murein DD-endopeptidase MepM/ murein hydrolase activator NlpD